jgi:hypothetical protein
MSPDQETRTGPIYDAEWEKSFPILGLRPISSAVR